MNPRTVQTPVDSPAADSPAAAAPSADGGDVDAARSTVAQDPPPTWIEWGVRAVSFALVAALVTYVLVTGFRSNDPPTFEFDIDRAAIEQRDGSWVVPVVMRNAGDVSVTDFEADLVVAAADGSIVERNTVHVEIFGHGASVDTEFRLTVDPRAHNLAVDIASYQLP